MNRKRLLVLLLMLAVIGLFFALGGHRWLSLPMLQARLDEVQALRAAWPVATVLLFAGGYVCIAVFALPGGVLLTLFAGAVFGWLEGSLVVSLSSTMAATIAFAVTRWLLREPLQQRYPQQMATVARGFAQDGVCYLVMLRMIPAFPFFLINWLMALTPIRWWTYVWVSWISMLPGTLLYVNAGRQFARLEDVRGIVTPDALLSLLALGVFPLLARHVLAYWSARYHRAQHKD